MSEPDAEWWAKLVEALRDPARRRAAIGDFYGVMGRRIRYYLQGKGLQRADADDLMQDVIVKVTRHIDDFRGDADGFPKWVWTIVRNTHLDAHRARKPSHSVDDPDDVVGQGLTADIAQVPDVVAMRESVADCVRRGFRRFAEIHPDRAHCLAWLATDRLDLQAVAELLGRSAGATREYLSQCRKKLKPFLEPCYLEER
jgi:RNA polymerase sigma factor (sigma-70 family)